MKNQLHHIILAIDLTYLNFNSINLNRRIFFRLNPTMSDGLMSAKLGHMLNYTITIVYEELY